MILTELFISFLKIGLFSFGGGYAAIPLIYQEVVTNHQWLSVEAFSDVLTISQMTPGPVGINSATFIGIQLDGLVGAAVATIGFVIPSFIIVSILGHFYLKYNDLKIIKQILNNLRPVVIALILSAGVTIFLEAVFVSNKYHINQIDITQLALFTIAMVLTNKFKMSLIKVMLLVGLLNVAIQFIIK